ncbi:MULTISPECIES: helix-turn-helix domain-containing protein [Bordetella]|uniref:Phage protein n=1 Tax=Bordetella parapertussis (strain Bpp5) TaxID=1208660 RepID=K0MDE4_BORPB|nr:MULTISPECIES: phage protein [Bordetella]CCJ49412.1 Phage protein [Bordetella parapertussis Bpp5]
MSLLQIPIVSQWLSNVGMLIDDIRRTNLALLAKEAGGVGRLAEHLEKDQSQVSQWLNASKNSATGTPRGMRSATCRAIEEKMGKPPGWLDIDHAEDTSTSDAWPFPRLARADFEALTQPQKEAIEDWVISQVRAFGAMPAVKSDEAEKAA